MAEKSRTEYSARNTTVAVISKVLAILMGYITRVVFTHTLSESYVGINGLFTDILNVLSLSELGMGTAITYALYRPIADGNIEKQKSLMQLYRRLYLIVAAVVMAAGLMIIPFMDVLIKDSQNIEHITLIYLMYLANSAVSYLLIYKKTLIDAHQLSYIGELFHAVFLVIQNAVQIVVLKLTGNFILFLGIYIICTVVRNICISIKANRLYPFLKDKNPAPLDGEERRGIFKNIKAMLMHRIGDVVVNNTDNLLLSSMVGLTATGKYSNYFLLIGSVKQILDQVFNGITASVGNLGATSSADRAKRIFDATFFIGQWMYGFSAICLYELLSPFVAFSFGSKYVFAQQIELVLCINFFITGMRKPVLVFRDSLGLFWYDRYKSIAEAVINLVVSIVLALNFGTIGVFLGTFISTVTTSTWVEPFILYRHYFKTSLARYFARYAIYSSVAAAAWLITDYLCSFIHGGTWALIFGRLAICLLIPNLIMLAAYFKTKEFRFVVNKAVSLIKVRISK